MAGHDATDRPNGAKPIVKIQAVTVRFAGDSGDGMQLAGMQFTDTCALAGNDVSTFPDYPSEIRAPAGTIAGVSGYQIQFSSQDIFTPGDDVAALVAMNPAALKVNLKAVNPGGLVIVNSDAFTAVELRKAGYATNPLDDGSLESHRVVKAPIDTLNAAALKDLGLTPKQIDLCKNFFALGVIYWLYGRPLEPTLAYIQKKFGKKNPQMAQADEVALRAGYNFGDTCEFFDCQYHVEKADLAAGDYRRVTGNEAAVLGLVAAAELAGKELFYGSYPITPASEILHGLSELKHFRVTTFQAEDEICAIGAAIGAAFGGAIAVTGTSGPGLALKTEAMGLAVMTELPLVIINVQRGGPSTGLPTKTEQSDLLQAVYGRNGECPIPVIAAASPADCFAASIEAVRIALRYMTPVLLLSDGFVGNSSEPWLIPDVNELAPIYVAHPVAADGVAFAPYARNADGARPWAIPGTPGLEHRIGGLEKQAGTGAVSYDPVNHEVMVQERAKKVAGIEPAGEPYLWTGPRTGSAVLVSWGGTYGSVKAAALELNKLGHHVGHCHLRYINPLPRDLADLLGRFEQVIIPELNLGQLRTILRATLGIQSHGLSKVRGLPLTVKEIVTEVLTQIAPPEPPVHHGHRHAPVVWVNPEVTTERYERVEE